MILRARMVWPVARPPLEDGAVQVRVGRLAFVGRWADLAAADRRDVLDLGECLLLPGLINAHCHLDYTDMAGHIPPPKNFPDWIKAILAEKAACSYSDYARAWVRGAQQLVRNGTTTVADIEAVPELLPDVWDATPLRVHSFLEMTGVRSRRAPGSVLGEAVETIRALPDGPGRVGLSPHAAYSTTAGLLQQAAVAARQNGWRLTTHVAESAAEMEMFQHGRGPMFDWLARNERDMSDCGHGSPIEHLERCGLLGENLLAAHANYLAPGDADRLARAQTSVVHCPRSHAYFGHQAFPGAALTAAGVNVCLGTDSLASVKKITGEPLELNLFAEMRTRSAAAPGLSPETIVRQATLHGARALGRAGELGELTADARADLIALPFAGKPADAAAAVVHHPGAVTASLIDGRWAIAPA